MFAIDLANEIADTISQMKDGEVSSVARMVRRVVGGGYDGDMFSLLGLVEFACAERGVYLDYHEHYGKEEGLPFNLTFIKRSSDSVGALPNDARVCVLHHPRRGCEQWPGMKYEDFGIDTARIVFDGPFDEAKRRYWKCDSGSGFTIDCRLAGDDHCVIVLVDGAYKKPFEAFLAGYGEAITYEVPLCDAAEDWTFIVYRGELNIDDAMEGYRKAPNGEYVCMYDEQERDELFARFPVQNNGANLTP